MLDVSGELLLVLRIQTEHLNEPLDVNTLEVAVGERLHITARLDHHFTDPVVRSTQVLRDVTSDEVSFPFTK